LDALLLACLQTQYDVLADVLTQSQCGRCNHDGVERDHDAHDDAVHAGFQ
jgi:hypothetical protein